MNPDIALDIFQHTVYLIMSLSLVILLPGLIVGLIISIFQAATQINEMSLTFVPKFIATLVTLMLTGNWMMATLTDYMKEIITQMPYLIG